MEDIEIGGQRKDVKSYDIEKEKSNSFRRCGTTLLTEDQVDTSVNGIKVDKFGRSKIFTPFACGGPWFKNFHFSWLSFFLAFTAWFSIVPALQYIKDADNGITKADIKTSNIISVLGTIIVRFSLGPMCERFGPRRVQSVLLCYGTVMVALAATINNVASLLIIRFLIGMVGGAFVPCQYWTTMMFASNIVGSANAFAGGWGNLGGGFANTFMAAVIASMRSAFNDDTAWRVAMAVPALMCATITIPMYLFGNDSPQGKWDDRMYNNKKKGTSNTGGSKCAGFNDWRVWVLAMQYGACFGIELTINNSMAAYLEEYFVVDSINCRRGADGSEECSLLGRDTAGMIAGLFGLMNLFARAIGGVVSDWAFGKIGFRGRLITQFVCLAAESAALIIFSQVTNLPLAIIMLIVFSVCVQSSEGSTYSIVPFMNKNAIGQVAGIVGAGGNIGAVIWQTLLKGMVNQSTAYLYLGLVVAATSILTFFIPVNGVYITCGKEEKSENREMIKIPSTPTSRSSNSSAISHIPKVPSISTSLGNFGSDDAGSRMSTPRSGSDSSGMSTPRSEGNLLVDDPKADSKMQIPGQMQMPGHMVMHTAPSANPPKS